MLDKLRENKSSFLINFIIGLIVVVFIFWGSGMSRSGRPASEVARVNGKPISDIELGRAVGNRIEQQRRFGLKPTPEDEAKIQTEMLDQLIERELMLQEAIRLKVAVSDEELKKSIIENPGLKDENGNFDVTRFQRIKKRYPTFESDERERLVLDKLETLVRGAVMISDADLWEAYERDNTKVNLEYVKVPFATFSAKAEVSAEEKAAFLKDHGDEVRARYDRDFEKVYKQPKQVKASHILLKYEESDSPETKAELRKKMEEIKAMSASRDFAELAREFSEDPGSTGKGGDLGFFDEKRMDAAFSQVAFSTPAGQISDIVESRFGLHIIKVEEVKEASEKSFDEVKEEIATTLIRDNKGPELARKQAEGLKDAWVNNKPELAGLLEADGLKIDETGLTNRMNDNIRGIGKSKELADAAFALRAGNPPPNELFTVGESLVLIRFKERQEADGADFEKQKSSLETRARREKEKQVFDAWMDGLKAKAKIETNLAATVGT